MPKQSHSGFGLLEMMIALSLSALIMLILLNLFISTKNTYLKQTMFADIEDRMRFMSLYLSQQIRMAGNGSCESKLPTSIAEDVRVYDAHTVNQVWGVTIESSTNAVELRECVLFHDAQQFLPVLFFVADTHRVNHVGKPIDALFMKIDQHPREELIPGVIAFRVQLVSAMQPENHTVVLINYVLSSINEVLKNSRAYWFQGVRIVPSDHEFYQPGILLTAIWRNNA